MATNPAPKVTWDADRYEQQFGYVSQLAAGVLDLLTPRPGETILDLGRGTGERVSELAAPILYRDGTWYADYWRLRFVAYPEGLGQWRALG